MFYFDSLEEARNLLEAANIANETVTMKRVRLLNIKHVPRGDEKRDIIFLKDVIDTTANGLPFLRTDIRADWFRFFNTQLTNHVNRIMKSCYSKITIVNGEPKQTTLLIDNYIEDVNYLLNKAAKERDFQNALNNINIVSELDMEDEDAVEAIEAFMAHDEKVLPLVYINEVDMIKVDKNYKPSNSKFEKGMPMLIKDKFNTLFPGSGLTEDIIERETVVISDDDIYLLNHTYMGNVSIRRYVENEFFSYKVLEQ